MAAFAQQDAVAVMAQLLYVQRNPSPLGRSTSCATPRTARMLTPARHGARRTRRHPAELRLLRPVPRRQRRARRLLGVQELDFASNLANGAWARTNLGALYKLQSTEAGKVAFADFACYPPSYDGPASFLGAPVFDGSTRLGSVIVQMPIDRINAIAGALEGLGKTGEVILVGNDHLMRSDSRHQPKTHSVVASFRNPDTGKLTFPQIDEALAGKSGTATIHDDDGGEELAHWQPSTCSARAGR